MILLVSTASAGTAHVLSNEAEATVTILSPVVREYSLDNSTWQTDPILFVNAGQSDVTIYVKTTNYADKQYDTWIFHYFTHYDNLTRSHTDFTQLFYSLYNDTWDKKCMWSTGKWKHDYLGNQTISFRYKDYTWVNDITPLMVRYEKIEVKFHSQAKLGDYYYDSTINIIGGP